MPKNENFIESFLREATLKLAQNPVQQPPKPPVDLKQLQATTAKLISNLKQSYSPISMAGKGEIFQKNIFNIDSLMSWIIQNKVKVNGHRVAYPQAHPKDGNASPQSGEQVEADDQKMLNEYISDGMFLVWREGLAEFLKALRKQAHDSGNLYFQELTTSAIEDANANQKYDLGLETEEVEEKQPESEQQDQQAPAQPGQQGQRQDQQPGAYQNTTFKQQQEKLTEVLKQYGGGSASFILPYDLNTDQFNFRAMHTFASQVNGLVDENLISQNYVDVLRNNNDTTMTLLAQITNRAPAQFKGGGFSININTSLETFATVCGSYTNAYNFLQSLVPLVDNINNTLRSLKGSPVVVNRISKEVLDAQEQKGASYITWIQKYLRDLQSEIKRVGK